jgi:hypothetical protein
MAIALGFTWLRQLGLFDDLPCLETIAIQA